MSTEDPDDSDDSEELDDPEDQERDVDGQTQTDTDEQAAEEQAAEEQAAEEQAAEEQAAEEQGADEDEHEDEEAEDDDLRYFVRIGQTDLDGTRSVERALTEMSGIGRRAARLLARKAGVDRREIFGALDDETIDEIVSLVEGFDDETPDWMANHRREYYGGETTHEIGNDLAMTRRHDINRMKMINSYKGARHKRGQKVRGQRTKSTGRTEGTVGVNVEAIQEEAEAEAEEEEATARGGEL